MKDTTTTRTTRARTKKTKTTTTTAGIKGSYDSQWIPKEAKERRIERGRISSSNSKGYSNG